MPLSDYDYRSPFEMSMRRTMGWIKEARKTADAEQCVMLTAVSNVTFMACNAEFVGDHDLAILLWNAALAEFFMSDVLKRHAKWSGSGMVRCGRAKQGEVWQGNVRFKEIDMKEIVIEIEGTAPLLQNRYVEQSDEKPTRRQMVKTVDRRVVAETKCYRMLDGTLALPTTAVIGSIVNAGSNHKMKGSRKSLRFVVPAAVRAVAEFAPLHVPQSNAIPIKDFEVDSRSVVIPSTKGRIMCHRPRIDAWAATFVLKINDDVLDGPTIHQLLNEAGEQVGVGDFRPEKRGPFGTFRVVRWDERELALAAE